MAALDLVKEDFSQDYWNWLWHWYKSEGGFGHVAAFLAEYSLSGFNPKAPTITDAHRAPEDAELADVLDKLGDPEVEIMARAKSGLAEFYLWLRDRKNRRITEHRMEKCDGQASEHASRNLTVFRACLAGYCGVGGDHC